MIVASIFKKDTVFLFFLFSLFSCIPNQNNLKIIEYSIVGYNTKYENGQIVKSDELFSCNLIDIPHFIRPFHYKCIYNNNLLIIGLDQNRDSTYYSYNDNLLIKKEKYNNGCLVSETVYKYDDKSNLIDEETFYNNNSFSYKIVKYLNDSIIIQEVHDSFYKETNQKWSNSKLINEKIVERNRFDYQVSNKLISYKYPDDTLKILQESGWFFQTIYYPNGNSEVKKMEINNQIQITYDMKNRIKRNYVDNNILSMFPKKNIQYDINYSVNDSSQCELIEVKSLHNIYLINKCYKTE